MKEHMTQRSNLIFLLLWTGITVLGWSFVPINTLYPYLHSYWDVAITALDYTVYGFAIGLIIGLGQFLLLQHRSSSSKIWFVMTVVGYMFSWTIGLVIFTFILAIIITPKEMFPSMVNGISRATYTPYPLDTLLGGWAVGAAQWIALRNILPHLKNRWAVFWILGNWLSTGLGIILILDSPIPAGPDMIIPYGIYLSPLVARIITGAISGLISGGLLLFICRHTQNPSHDSSF